VYILKNNCYAVHEAYENYLEHHYFGWNCFTIGQALASEIVVILKFNLVSNLLPSSMLLRMKLQALIWYSKCQVKETK
jgi:hypothetical protein